MDYNTNDFQKDVIEKSFQIPVLVDFWAEWCGPCKVLGPVLEKVAEKHKERFAFVKLNTEDYPEISAQYGIRGIPNVKLFLEGKPINEFTGALPEPMIEDWLSKNIPGPGWKKMKIVRELLENARLDEARTVLQEIVDSEPENMNAAILLAKLYLREDPGKAVQLVEKVEEYHDGFQETEGIRTFGHLFQLAEDASALPAGSGRADYVAAIKYLQQDNYGEALKNFISVIENDRGYDDDGARKACIAIFKYLGENHPVTREYRTLFSRALYV